MMEQLKFKICSVFTTANRLQRLSTGSGADDHKPPFNKDAKTNKDIESFASELNAKSMEHLFTKWKKNTYLVHKSWDRYFREVKKQSTLKYIKMHPLVDGSALKRSTDHTNPIQPAKLFYVVIDDSKKEFKRPKAEINSCNISTEIKKVPASELIRQLVSTDEPELVLTKRTASLKEDATSSCREATIPSISMNAVAGNGDKDLSLANVTKLKASEGDESNTMPAESNVLQKGSITTEHPHPSEKLFQLVTDDIAESNVQDNPQADRLKNKEILLDALKYCDSRVDREAIHRQLEHLDHIEIPPNNENKNV